MNRRSVLQSLFAAPVAAVAANAKPTKPNEALMQITKAERIEHVVYINVGNPYTMEQVLAAYDRLKAKTHA
jgi:hypothetical protein